MRAVGNADLPSLSLLVRLTLSDDDGQTVVSSMNVPHVQPHQLGAAEGAGKADQQQGPVPDADEAVAQGVHHAADLGGDGGGFALLVGSFGAADACPDEADGGGSGRRFVSSGLMHLGDSGEPPAERAGFEGIGERGEVEGDGLGFGGKRDKAVGLAPAGEVVPVGGVGTAGVVGFGLLGVVIGLLSVGGKANGQV